MLTKDESGQKYVYGLKEFAIANLDASSTAGKVSDRYTVDKSSEYDTEVTVGEVVDKNQTITVKNTWKNMNVSIRKVWEDGSGSEKYAQIEMKLMQKIGEDGTWTAVQDQPNKIVSVADNWLVNDAWTGLPRETSDGQKIYYRAEEVNAKQLPNGDLVEEPIENGAYYPSEDGDCTTSLSVKKNWSNDTTSEKSSYDSITVQLMKKVGDGSWENVEQKVLNAGNHWRVSWSGLTTIETTGEVKTPVYYRAQEVSAKKRNMSAQSDIAIADNADFYTRPDAAGINAFGESVVTNIPKKIKVNMLKKWVSTQSAPTGTIKVTLMASTNGGATWVNADSTFDSSITESALKEIEINGTSDLEASWSNLPTKKTVGGIERDVVYKLVEEPVTGYSTTIEPAEISKNGTVTITNTEQAPYTKKAANPVPSIEATINHHEDTKTVWEGSESHEEPDEYDTLDAVKLINANDGILQNNTLSSDEMSKVDTAVVNINGVDTECYLFKWRIDMETNQTQSDTSNVGYCFTDVLKDGSVFYDDCGVHGIKIESNGGGNDGLYYAHWQDYYRYAPNLGFAYDSHLNVTYNSDKTQATFDMKTPSNGMRVAYITYYTATPKSIVDAALESTGEFVLTNRIQEEKETSPTLVDLHVSGGNEAGYIDKINNSGSGTAESSASGSQKTYAALKNGTAHYTLDVNKDSKYLSSGNTVSVTDIFRVLDYTSADGNTKQSGTDVTLKPELKNVGVFYYDTDGNRSRVDPSEYSYSTSVEENGKYETSTDYSDKFSNANLILWGAGNGVLLNTLNETLPAGLEVILNYRGTPNSEARIDNINTLGNAENEKGIKIDVLSETYDSSGIVKVKLTFTEDFMSGQSGQLHLTNYVGDTPRTTVESAVLKTSTPCKNYVTKFTLPDGGHYEIMYDYAIKNADDTEIESGALLTLQNEAKVHTSGGDKSDDSAKTSYCIQNSGVISRVGQNFEVVKVDIGNQSIADLNPTFKFAKFDTVQNKWVYADGFQFKNNYSELHEASFESGLTETEGNIPSGAADMELAGSYEIELEKTVLYKFIETKAPDNHEDFKYPKVPYQNEDHSVAGNADNTYYIILNENDTTNNTEALTQEQLTALANSAGVSMDKIRVTNSNDPMLTVPNVRLIDIGAKKTWEQDPNSAVNDVQVAVQLWQSDTKDIDDAHKVENQSALLAQEDLANYDATMDAYILKKDSAWTQEKIWQNLPNGNINTRKPYYYFVKEVAYKIGTAWYKYDSDKNSNTYGKFVDTNGNVWVDAAGNSAEYKPSYTDDATNSSGVIGIVNSRKLLVKKQWQDKSGNRITDPPVSSIDFNLYGITEDGTEVKITLPEDRQKLTAPNWEIEVPQDLISGEGINYVRYRVEEVTELEDYIVSDVYALNGNIGVMYLINKSTNPTSVNVNVTKTWADGNDAHGTEDAVTFTLYQFTGKQTVNQAFVENFISTGSYNGVTKVTGIDNPITLDGTETDDDTNAVTVIKGVAGDTSKQDLANGIVEANIYNTKGTQLPSTGGMGTILFYTVGGIMVIGAGVVLVTKKRSKNEQ